MGIKTWAADEWFSKCVRERCGWTCECCGTVYESGSQGFHCMHIIGRANKRVRWDGMNAIGGCAHCHFTYTGDPLSFRDFVYELLGDGHIELLREKSRTKMFTSKKIRDEVSAHYRKEYRRMLEERKNGHEGRLDFVSYL